jgi:hypothetical protein
MRWKLPFPFSDLSQAKPRPALVLAGLQGDDVILLNRVCRLGNRGLSRPCGKDV